MKPKDRLIVALDVRSQLVAAQLVDLLFDHVGVFKLGLRLFTAGGPELVRQFVQGMGASVFLDHKFHSIPSEVAEASAEATRLGIRMFTVHCAGGVGMMQAAKQGVDEMEAEQRTENSVRPKILGVTLLTSLGYEDLQREGSFPALNADAPARVYRERIEELVLQRSLLAREAGLDGVVTSPQEVPAIREACGPEFLIVATGTDLGGAAARDDHKRTGPLGQAIRDGADYVVVGRAILQSRAPVKVAQRITEEIAAAMEEGR